MPTPIWQPGTLYAPGALVQPASALAGQPSPVTNGGFEDGDNDWTMAAGFSIGQFGNGTHFQGTWSLQWDLGGDGRAINEGFCPVVPGQVINGSCQVQQGASDAGQAGARAEIAWYNESDELISFSSGNLVTSTSNQNWKQSTVNGTAPAGAAFARFSVYAFRTGGSDELWVDNCAWDAINNVVPTGLVFKAVQAVAGFSGSTEPTWPLVLGQTVVDNQVTWEAVIASRVTWEATPILVSGSYEPDWPTIPGGTVADGTIKWVAMSARVEDEKCPNGKIGVAAASKIFSVDEEVGDIISFCATVNPLDWSSEADAGYLPFGLNTYGSTPCAALGLYRSNVVAFNSEGYQMWQVDEDPANMALLDASPVDCVYRKSIQAVMNDLAFLSSQGVRNIGIAGASTNLQAGSFGKQVDPLVLAKIQQGLTPISLFYPGAGQYWLIFGEEAFILTINSAKDQSWSRYVFPYPITDWAILEGKLFLRAEELVWEFSTEALGADDIVCDPDPPVLSGDVEEVGEELELTAVLTWTEVEGAIYRLYDAETYELIVETDELTYSLPGLEVGESYPFYVVSVDANGNESAPSNIVTLEVDLPSAPILTGAVEDIGGGNFTFALEWTASTPPSHVTGYRLYDASDDSLIVQQAGLTYDDTPYGFGITKSFYVRAYGPGGNESVPSNTLVLDTANEGTIIDIFTSNSTWTKRVGLESADVYVLGDGGGGAAGGGGPNTGRGGGGGAGGGFAKFTIDASFLGATEDVVVGQGGAGSPSVQSSASGTPATNGADGTGSAFGAWATAGGGTGGVRNPGNGDISSSAGGVGNVTGAAGPTSIVEENGGTGRVNSSNPPGSTTYAGAGGGQGGRQSVGDDSGEPGGTCTNDGVDWYGSDGGDGGTAVQEGNAVAGGDASRGGGGGGGGAAGENIGGPADHFDSGRGGNGGPGLVVVVNYMAV